MSEKKHTLPVGCPWQAAHFATGTIVCLNLTRNGRTEIQCAESCNQYQAWSAVQQELKRLREEAEEKKKTPGATVAPGAPQKETPIA